MHTQFTSYHTIGVVFTTAAIIFIVSKLAPVEAKQWFTLPVLLKLLAASILVAGLLAMYSQQVYSGMNRIKAFGLPRGFYQVVTEPGGLQKKLFVFRYALENIVVVCCIASLVYFFFRLFSAR